MSNRNDLIARKNEVRGRINQIQRELVHEQTKGEKVSKRRLRTLENELERLQAEEYRLRLEIDRSQR